MIRSVVTATAMTVFAASHPLEKYSVTLPLCTTQGYGGEYRLDVTTKKLRPADRRKVEAIVAENIDTMRQVFNRRTSNPDAATEETMLALQDLVAKLKKGVNGRSFQVGVGAFPDETVDCAGRRRIFVATL